MRTLTTGLMTSTALWAPPDDPKSPATVASLDLGEFDMAMGDNGASSQATDGFEEIDQDQAKAEILERHQSVQHIDSDDDETSTGVRDDGPGGDVEEGGQKRDKPEAQEKPAQTPEEKAAADAAAAQQQEESNLPDWVKERLAREKRKTARIEAELAAARQTPAAPAKPTADAAPPTPAEPPKAADFEDFEEYMEAKALYDRSQRALKDKPAPKADTPAPSPDADKMRIQIAGVIGEINAVLEDDHPELHKIVNDPANPKGLKITPGMILAIGETDNPAAVLQAFVDNPALTVELAGLPPEKAAVRIAKLDKPSTAKAPAQAPQQQRPAPKISQAPEPIAPLDGTSRVPPSYEEADFKTFEQQRRAEEKDDDPFSW